MSPAHENPIPALTQTYRSTLALLQKDVPESSVYRQSVEALTQHRLSILENAKEDDVLKVEKEIGQGQIEELIGAAEREFYLVEKMIEWKASVTYFSQYAYLSFSRSNLLGGSPCRRNPRLGNGNTLTERRLSAHHNIWTCAAYHP
jgi:ETC complex I subunit conserved region